MEFVFDRNYATDINKSRLDHLASLGLNLEKLSVLEVGSGVGSLTGFFEKLDCSILSTDVRQANIEEHGRRFPHRRIEFADLSRPGSHDHFGLFDIVFCYGALYHLSNPELAIKDLSHVCDHLFILETCVNPADNGEVNPVAEPRESLDQSIEGIRCRPARNWILSKLRKYFPYVYITASQPDHTDFPLKWPASSANSLTRSVFVASRQPIDSKILLQHLPAIQYTPESFKSAHSNLKCKTSPIGGILFDDFRVLIDSRALMVGGSWQGVPRKGAPTAWDMDTIKFFYERTLEFENPRILDIGANTGSFCLLPKINTNISGYAFEPTPVIYDILKNNIALNNLNEKIKALPIALSDKKGTAILKYPKSGTDSGFACLGKPLRFKDWIEIEVPVTTLDNVANEQGIEQVDLIKIDTEGCELFVLKGAEGLIREFHPAILTEYYDQNTRQFGYHAEEIKELLCSWGYESKQISSEDMYFHKAKSKAFPLSNVKPFKNTGSSEAKEKFREWMDKVADADLKERAPYDVEKRSCASTMSRSEPHHGGLGQIGTFREWIDRIAIADRRLY
ncbi:MAG: FkbM family methyltransferase, partial [Desulfobacteraceae bacterium]|nr:FkbM family methyltransferase [Desulfobacteraceae bacterium]